MHRLNALRQKPFFKLALFLLKIFVSVYILWRIAAKVDFSLAFSGISSLTFFTILLVLLITIFRHICQYFNWMLALKINPGFKANASEIFNSYMIGLPLRFAIPGGHASVAKIFYVSNSSRMASLWSTALERGFMTWSSWCFAAAAGLYYYTQWTPWLFIGLFTVCLLIPEAIKMGLNWKPEWKALRDNYNLYAPRMLILQVGNSLLTYLQYWLILNCFHPISSWDTWMRMALTQFSNTIPITVGGLGLREGFAMHFLKGAGFTAEQAVSATLSLFIIQDIFPALVGGFFLLKTRRN